VPVWRIAAGRGGRSVGDLGAGAGEAPEVGVCDAGTTRGRVVVAHERSPSGVVRNLAAAVVPKGSDGELPSSGRVAA
jgi:hypothetical protein